MKPPYYLANDGQLINLSSLNEIVKMGEFIYGHWYVGTDRQPKFAEYELTDIDEARDADDNQKKRKRRFASILIYHGKNSDIEFKRIMRRLKVLRPKVEGKYRKVWSIIAILGSIASIIGLIVGLIVFIK